MNVIPSNMRLAMKKNGFDSTLLRETVEKGTIVTAYLKQGFRISG